MNRIRKFIITAIIAWVVIATLVFYFFGLEKLIITDLVLSLILVAFLAIRKTWNWLIGINSVTYENEDETETYENENEVETDDDGDDDNTENNDVANTNETEKI